MKEKPDRPTDVSGSQSQGTASPNYVVELVLVAALSLGKSAVYAVVDLADTLSRGPLSDAQAQLNTSASPRPWFDLIYQLLGIGFAVVPVALALYLLSRDRAESARPVRTRIGMDMRHPGRDLLATVVLFLVIGVGTLLVYAAGRALGITAQVQTNNLGAHWWTVPVLILSAVKNGLLEEIVLLGFGADRLRRLHVPIWVIVLGLAVFRASYHLYQGFGPFLGNVAMGMIFGWLYLRGPAWLGRGRVMPFVLAHTAIDTVGFLAPGLLA